MASRLLVVHHASVLVARARSSNPHDTARYHKLESINLRAQAEDDVVQGRIGFCVHAPDLKCTVRGSSCEPDLNLYVAHQKAERTRLQDYVLITSSCACHSSAVV